MSPTLVESSDGIEIAAHELGGAHDAPLVLMAHATGFHGHSWEPVAKHLSTQYRCVALDFRGHGHSAIPDWSADLFGWDRMVDDFLAVKAALSDGPVLAVGWSMGGAAIAGAELRRPGTVNKAFLFEPVIIPEAGMFLPGETNPLSDTARSRRSVFDSREQVVDRYRSRPPFDTSTDEALRAYVDHGFADRRDGTVELRCSPRTEGAVFDGWNSLDFSSLADISPPVTVVGSDDMEGPGVVAEYLANALPAGSFAKFDGLSHFAPMEHPQRVAEAIASSLDAR